MDADADSKLKRVVFNVDAEPIEPTTGESKTTHSLSTVLQRLKHSIQLETELDKDGFRVWTNKGEQLK